ncbi:MAG: cobalt-precorrin-5B (C(1))-methyltransferase CbiD [Cyanobacteria bacterium]|nr:cobalt-precorrin-5B (C(1))-methyltransferase CbiD [Cyanobacteriota bacterium]
MEESRPPEMAEKTGYILPVFAAAAACGALRHLLGGTGEDSDQPIILDLLDGTTAAIALEQVARLDEGTALAIARSDPGPNLDLTRHTPVWAWVRLSNLAEDGPESAIAIEGGEGIGRQGDGQPAIYRYARELLEVNLRSLLPPDRAITVRLILPEGRSLAKRTSNEAFGVIEGLSLLGTQGTVEAHTAPERLAEFCEELRAAIASQPPGEGDVAFCIGSNGRRVAETLGIPAGAIASVGNWLGPLLAAAADAGARSILLLGYHGKLIKLAGGIFNTSSHVADGKLEILTAAALRHCDEVALLRQLAEIPTIAAAQKLLADHQLDKIVFTDLAERISARATAYAQKYGTAPGDRPPAIGTWLFDRTGTPVAHDAAADLILQRLRDRAPHAETNR